MQKWEYLRVLVNTNPMGSIIEITANEEEVFRFSGEAQSFTFNLFEYFSKLGKQGWEMVNALPWWDKNIIFYIFKRPIE